jgi:DNA-binding transcriptional LysR family regulator
VLRREQLHWVRALHHRAHLEDPLPLAVYPDGCVYRRWAEQALRKAGRSWRIAITSASRSAIEAMLLQGLAVSVFPASTLRRPLIKLGKAEGLPKLPYLELALHRRKNAGGGARHALAQAIIDALRR